MNFKLSALVAAALLASGSVHAMTPANDVASGNSTLLLTVIDANYNNGAGRSYTRSLEVAMNDFGTQNRATGGFSTIADTLGGPLTWNGGSLWSTFTAGMTAQEIAGLQWDVTALDQTGTSAADQKRIITTSADNLVDLVALSGTSISNAETQGATPNQQGC